MLTELQDAYGRLIMDHWRGIKCTEIVERDDGYMDASGGPADYFQTFDEMSDDTRKALSFVCGRTLDIGCGAGRHSLYLQSIGHQVVGIDISPLAVEVCRERGLNNVRVMSVVQIRPELGRFDSIIMFGNNLSLLGSPRRGPWLLKRLRRIVTDDGVIVGQTRDPYQTDSPDHLVYQELNRRRGRMSGHVRIRIRYRIYKTPWFDYLFMSPDELAGLAEGTGWAVRETIPGADGVYFAVLGKA